MILAAIPYPQNALNTRNSVIAYLLSHQNTDGGWAYSAATSEASMTAMVLRPGALPESASGRGGGPGRNPPACPVYSGPAAAFAYDGAENSNDAAMVVIA